MMLAPVLSLLALATLPSPLPSTFTFIDRSYAGDRFINDTVVVFGGTSGIGFAAAAMLLAECAATTAREPWPPRCSRPSPTPRRARRGPRRRPASGSRPRTLGFRPRSARSLPRLGN